MSICLAMIVKDEAEVIERCLTSVLGLIDSFLIVDTGSTDGTAGMAYETLTHANVPGLVVERPWVDFGTTRTELLRLARGTEALPSGGRGINADYLLLLDADMTVEVTVPARPPSDFDPEMVGGDPFGWLKRSFTADAYMLRYASPLAYSQRLLVRRDLPWRYVGTTHEYLTRDGDPLDDPTLEALLIHHHGDGGSRPGKLERDRVLLAGAIEDDPTDERATFYLASTERDRGDDRAAADLFERRAAMDGWDQEVYVALVEAARARERLIPGNAATTTLLMRAWETRPARAEAVYELAKHLRLLGFDRAALAVATSGLGIVQPDDALFVEPWVYEWGLLFEFSIAAGRVGMTAEATAAGENLELLDLPANVREAVERNLALVGRAAETPPPRDVEDRRPR